MHVRDLKAVRLEPALDQSEELEDPAHRRRARGPEPDERRRAGALDEFGAEVRYRSLAIRPPDLTKTDRRPEGWVGQLLLQPCSLRDDVLQSRFL
jgi:hypothetical protein